MLSERTYGSQLGKYHAEQRGEACLPVEALYIPAEARRNIKVYRPILKLTCSTILL